MGTKNKHHILILAIIGFEPKIPKPIDRCTSCYSDHNDTKKPRKLHNIGSRNKAQQKNFDKKSQIDKIFLLKMALALWKK